MKKFIKIIFKNIYNKLVPKREVKSKYILNDIELKKESLKIIRDHVKKRILSKEVYSIAPPFDNILAIENNLINLSNLLSTQSSKLPFKINSNNFKESEKNLRLCYNQFNNILAKILKQKISERYYPFKENEILEDIYSVFNSLDDLNENKKSNQSNQLNIKLKEWLIDSQNEIKKTSHTLTETALDANPNFGFMVSSWIGHALDPNNYITDLKIQTFDDDDDFMEEKYEPQF